MWPEPNIAVENERKHDQFLDDFPDDLPIENDDFSTLMLVYRVLSFGATSSLIGEAESREFFNLWAHWDVN